jgi:hypothetical protein
MSTGRLGAGDTAIQPTIFDAKADILTATAADTPARLAVGANDTVLTADSTTATGLKWAAAASVPESLGFTAGKNKIINGNFEINQRGFTSNTTNGTYNFDRWYQQNSGGTTTITPQNFTAGSAPVAGYEGRQFCQVITASQSGAGDYAQLTQAIEDVRTLAGQTATISFWAKATSGTPKISVEVIQRFGSGGSPSSDVQTYAGQATISTSWARYSITVAVPSLSGKTVGTTLNTSSTTWSFWLSAGTNFNARTGSLGVQNNTFQIWGVQVEAGSVATAFQTATGTLAGELAACQRYYFRTTAGSNETIINCAFAGNTTTGQGQIQFPVPMRVAPTSLDSATVKFANYAGSSFNMTSVLYNQASTVAAQVYGTISGATAGHAGTILGQTTGSYIGLSAEL